MRYAYGYGSGSQGAAHVGASGGSARPGTLAVRPDPGPSRLRGWVVAVGVIALVAAVIVGWLVLGGDSGTTSSTGGPTTALKDFLSAVQHQDYDAAAGVLCAKEAVNAQQLAAVFEQQFGEQAIASFKVDSPVPVTGAGTSDGEQAQTVRYTITSSGGKETTFQATMTSTSGRWCIADSKPLS